LPDQYVNDLEPCGWVGLTQDKLPLVGREVAAPDISTTFASVDATVSIVSATAIIPVVRTVVMQIPRSNRNLIGAAHGTGKRDNVTPGIGGFFRGTTMP
jgi:hypothetical protein